MCKRSTIFLIFLIAAGVWGGVVFAEPTVNAGAAKTAGDKGVTNASDMQKYLEGELATEKAKPEQEQDQMRIHDLEEQLALERGQGAVSRGAANAADRSGQAATRPASEPGSEEKPKEEQKPQGGQPPGDEGGGDMPPPQPPNPAPSPSPSSSPDPSPSPSDSPSPSPSATPAAAPTNTDKPIAATPQPTDPPPKAQLADMNDTTDQTVAAEQAAAAQQAAAIRAKSAQQQNAAPDISTVAQTTKQSPPLSLAGAMQSPPLQIGSSTNSDLGKYVSNFKGTGENLPYSAADGSSARGFLGSSASSTYSSMANNPLTSGSATPGTYPGEADGVGGSGTHVWNSGPEMVGSVKSGALGVMASAEANIGAGLPSQPTSSNASSGAVYNPSSPTMALAATPTVRASYWSPQQASPRLSALMTNTLTPKVGGSTPTSHQLVGVLSTNQSQTSGRTSIGANILTGTMGF